MPRVLIVEDEADIREPVAEALTEEGYEVDVAEDGLSALELVRERSPDLTILDLMLPGLNGYGFVRECRSDPRCAAMKIIILTAATPANLQELDGETILGKPFQLNQLLDTVTSLVPV